VSTESQVVPEGTRDGGFAAFVADNERPLRHSLSAALGSQVGHEAAAEALAYGWEHWDRISGMKNPVGYLYKVGRDRGRRQLARKSPVFSLPDATTFPMVEPQLPQALSKLSERQRVAVVLVHSFHWSLAEVADQLGVAKGTVQKHLERGLRALREELGVADD
jgi:DNA-directed RNA polymerase specialized sigma24 family protein